MRSPAIAIVGLGHVGQPLALEFGGEYSTTAYDVSPEKIARYAHGEDPWGEVPCGAFTEASRIRFTNGRTALGEADIAVVAVPTPVHAATRPGVRIEAAYRESIALGAAGIVAKLVDGVCIIDVQGRFDAAQFGGRDAAYWRP